MNFVPRVDNSTVCVGELCGAAAVAAIKETGLSADQNNIQGVYTSLVINAIIGALCSVTFIICRTFMRQYQLRLYLPQVTIKPPPLPDTGLGKIFGWLKPVLFKSDAFMLRSAGLDALVLQKVHALGLQICLPLAILGCCFVMPLQISQPLITGEASYGRLTAANIVSKSSIMWAHTVVLFVMLGWVFLLLEYHTRQYAAVRQHYLLGGDDPNYWRDLHMAEADGTLVHKQAKLLNVLGEARFAEDVLELEDKLEEQAKKSWWKRAMISLTSWTGQEDVAAVGQHAVVVSSSLSKKKSGSHLKGSSTPATPQPGSSDGADEVKVQRTHIGLAGDIIQGDFIRDAKLRSTVSSPDPSASGQRAATAVSTPTSPAHSPSPSRTPSKGTNLRSLVSMPARSTTSPPSSAAAAAAGSGCETASPLQCSQACLSVDVDEGGVLSAPPACCDMEAEEINNLVAHKWWTSVQHVATADGKLRRLTEAEEGLKELQSVMLAKPSVRHRKTVNATDRTGRRVAVNAQQYAVLVTNVQQPCYPEFMPSEQQALADQIGDRAYKQGAVMCGALDKKAIAAVKYDLEGPLKGHAEERHGPPVEAGPAPKGNGTSGAIKARKDPSDVEMGLRQDEVAQQQVHLVLPEGVDSSNKGPKRSGQELWGLVRKAAAEKRLSALGRSIKYSVVANIFSTLFPQDYDRVVPVFNYRRVDLLMRRWDVKQGKLEAAQKKLQVTGIRPTHKTKMFGGVEVDTIHTLHADIHQLEEMIIREREAALKYGQTPSWFVLFRSQQAAAVASSCNILPMNKDLFQVHPAPGPEEVNWEALWFNHSQRVMRGWVTAPFAIILVLLPVSLLTSAISSLDSQFCRAVKWDFYCGQLPIAKLLKGLVTGFLPSLLIILWQGLAMPRLVYMVAQSEGRHFSLSAVDRRMGELYFYWNIFNMFAQGVLGSAAVDAASGIGAVKKSGEFFNAPQEVPTIIGKSLPGSSKFFFTYIIMRTLMTVPLRFLITQPGVWQAWLRLELCGMKLLGRREADLPPRTKFMRDAIRSPRYGVEHGSTLLILLISLAFALISPLIILFGAAFCGGMWVFWRYQLMYNYQRKYESGGLMWHFFVNRVLVCCVIMVTFTGCVLIIKQGFVQAAIVWLFGIIFTLTFARHLNKRYMNAIVEMPLLLASQAPHTRVPSSIYVPPPLQANGLGWYPEFNKVWEWFGMPGYSL